MTREDCKQFDTCSAPLCPLDIESQAYGCWYPDEEICRNKAIKKPDWVEKQKRIVKLDIAPMTYFSIAMLNEIQRISDAICGADPDVPDSEKQWLRDIRGVRARQKKQRDKKGTTSKKTVTTRGKPRVFRPVYV